MQPMTHQEFNNHSTFTLRSVDHVRISQALAQREMLLDFFNKLDPKFLQASQLPHYREVKILLDTGKTAVQEAAEKGFYGK